MIKINLKLILSLQYTMKDSIILLVSANFFATYNLNSFVFKFLFNLVFESI